MLVIGERRSSDSKALRDLAPIQQAYGLMRRKIAQTVYNMNSCNREVIGGLGKPRRSEVCSFKTFPHVPNLLGNHNTHPLVYIMGLTGGFKDRTGESAYVASLTLPEWSR